MHKAMRKSNKEQLTKMHVVVTEVETGKILFDDTNRTVLVATSNDVEDEEITVMQYINGTKAGLVSCLISGKLHSLARLAVKVKDEMAEEDDN